MRIEEFRKQKDVKRQQEQDKKDRLEEELREKQLIEYQKYKRTKQEIELKNKLKQKEHEQQFASKIMEL